MSDTFRILVDAAGKDAPDTIAQFRKALASAADANRPRCRTRGLQVELRRRMRRAMWPRDLAVDDAANPESDGVFWSAALARQGAELRDDLVFLAPWLAQQSATDAADRLPGVERHSDAARNCRAPDEIVARGWMRETDGVGRARSTGRGACARCRRRGARFGTNDRNRGSLSLQANALAVDGLRLPVRQGAPPARHRVQRHRTPLRLELLRPARLRSTTVQFRRDRAGQAAAGELVRARPSAHLRRREARCCCRGAARCSSTSCRCW